MDETALLGLIDDILAQPAVASWHVTARQHLGVPEECAEETILSVTYAQKPTRAKPLAFVLEPSQNDNILAALREYLRMTFHPLSPDYGAVVLIDYMPPLASPSTKAGYSRRWVVDAFTHADVLRQVEAFTKKVMFS